MNRWHHYKQAPLLALEPPLASWLLDRGSLTRRLIEVSGGEFRVQRLEQKWRRPSLSEARALNVRSGQVVLIREVELLCHGKPWVYARTAIPVKTLKRKLGHLKHLGNQSLGSILFRNPRMKRKLFELTRVTPSHLELPASCTRNLSLWARRSLFELHRLPVLVTEVFLPPLAAHAKQVKL